MPATGIFSATAPGVLYKQYAENFGYNYKVQKRLFLETSIIIDYFYLETLKPPPLKHIELIFPLSKVERGIYKTLSSYGPMNDEQI